MTSLSKYFNFCVILPFVITSLSGIILAKTHDSSGYQSEWFTDDGFGYTVGLMILTSIVISALSLTLFLNKHEIVKRNILLSFICWMLLPGIICSALLYEETLNFTGQSDYNGVYEGNRLLDGYIMSAAALHLLGLLAGFILYRRQLKRQ